MNHVARVCWLPHNMPHCAPRAANHNWCQLFLWQSVALDMSDMTSKKETKWSKCTKRSLCKCGLPAVSCHFFQATGGCVQQVEISTQCSSVVLMRLPLDICCSEQDCQDLLQITKRSLCKGYLLR